jgi:FkbM family methyltransferase
MTASWWPTGQNLEDVFLFRCFKDLSSGRYLDVGAGNPSLPSVSLSFYKVGWSGILIEASEANSILLKKQRPNDLVLNIAASNSHTLLEFYEFEDMGISTLDFGVASKFESEWKLSYQIKQIQSMTLNSILDSQEEPSFEFLKIDVEGHEKMVLEGIDLLVYRPKVILIEAIHPFSKKRVSSTFRHILSNANYKFAYFDGLNEYFVSHEHANLLQNFETPISILDGAYFKNE